MSASSPGLHALCERTELPARGLEPSAIARGLAKNDKKLPDLGTLGARGLSCPVSGLGQCLYCDPREKPLEKSAVSFIAPSQWETCLNQFSPAFGLDSRLAPIDLPRVLCSNRLFDWFQE